MKNKKLILTMMFVGIAGTSLELLPAFIGISGDNDGIGIGIGRNGVGAEIGNLEVGVGSDYDDSYNNNYYDSGYNDNYDDDYDYDNEQAGVIVGAEVRHNGGYDNRRSRNIRGGRQARDTRTNSGKTIRGGKMGAK